MKGFIKHIGVVCFFSAALFAVLGCTHYREIVDPCWPERYNSMARHSIRQMHGAQSAQGHKLEQTVWNVFFETDAKTGEGTAVLNPAGMELLRVLSQREPIPDFQLWLQYPHDVHDPARRDIIIEQRKASIRSYLTAQTRLSNGDAYVIEVHDLSMPVYRAEWSKYALDNVEKGIKSGQAQQFPQPSQTSK